MFDRLLQPQVTGSEMSQEMSQKADPASQGTAASYRNPPGNTKMSSVLPQLEPHGLETLAVKMTRTNF